MKFSPPPGAVGVKLSTEDAGMSFAQIAAYVERYGGALEVVVKIGGPGARNDVAECLRLGARCLVAPMVESAYALEDFVAALGEANGRADRVRAGINVETRGAVERVEEILDSPHAGRLDLVVVGRSDLSRSMGRTPDDPEVLAAAARVVAAARARGKRTSVGGGVTPEGARRALEAVRPDLVNTRLFVLDPGRAEIGRAVAVALEAEAECLADDAARGFAPRAAADRRIAEIRRRLGRTP